MPRRLRESHAEDLIAEHPRGRGWNLVDFDAVERQYVLPSGNKADYVFKVDDKIVAVLEVKRPGRDLYAALAQARQYADEIRSANLGDAHLLFSADGYNWLRQNLAARTLPERLADEKAGAIRDLVDSLPTEVRQAIEAIVTEYGSLNQKELLDLVYRRYPEYTVNSKRPGWSSSG